MEEKGAANVEMFERSPAKIARRYMVIESHDAQVVSHTCSSSTEPLLDEYLCFPKQLSAVGVLAAILPSSQDLLRFVTRSRRRGAATQRSCLRSRQPGLGG